MIYQYTHVSEQNIYRYTKNKCFFYEAYCNMNLLLDVT